MLFMNRWDIEEAVVRYRTHPALGPAARFLRDFMEEVDNHSDGWAYWGPPVHACKQLIALLESRNPNVTIQEVRKALTPIKAFMTRRGNAAGMKMPELIEGGVLL